MGFADRLHKSIIKYTPKDMKITLSAPNTRNLTCWIGGSIVANLKAFNRMWVTKKEMEEEGTRVLLSKKI